MTLNIQTDAPPLRVTKDGVVMVGKTHVPLETVIWTYKEGSSPEEIEMSYDALALADVYAVIAYYLNHREDVEAYMEWIEAESERVRREIEALQPDMFSLRERLLARKAARQSE
ncbi:MAG: DUF433 domain-containing protein [Chloroflexota bacterium]